MELCTFNMYMNAVVQNIVLQFSEWLNHNTYTKIEMAPEHVSLLLHSPLLCIDREQLVLKCELIRMKKML